MKKNNKKKRVIVQSTQKNIPVKDIVNGVIVTTDGRFVKILEVKPVPFFLKTAPEQNAIYGSFYKLLKSCQVDIQLKVVGLNADLSTQLDVLNNEMAIEENDNCYQIDIEYQNTLLQHEQNGVTRRFFICFGVDMKNYSSKKRNASVLINELENVSDTIISYLTSCGNKVIIPKKEKADEYLAEILYILLNRKVYKEVPYSQKVEEVSARYFDELKTKDFFIPVTDCIAPNEIAFEDSRYVTIDKMYYRYAYIPPNGYKSIVQVGWLAMLSNTFSGVDVDVFINKVPKEQVMNNIRRNLTYSIVEASDASGTSEAFDVANSTYSSNQYLKDGLMNGQDFYYVSTIVTVCDEDAEYLDYKMDELIKSAKANDFKLKEIIFEPEQAFRSVLPLCKEEKVIFEKSKRNMLTEGVATFYPFTAYEISDDNGIYLGNDATTGALVVPDIFDRSQIESSNTFICGATGSGKTFTLSLIAERMRIKHIPSFIIAPEKQDEFRRLAVAIGGEFIEVGTSTGAIINIMQIFKPDENAIKKRELIDGMSKSKSYLDEKVGTVMTFIKLLVETNREQDALLSESIYDTYAKFGITPDNESLWKDEEKTEYKTMPILEDLQTTIGEKMVDEPVLRSIYNTMKYFTSGSGTTFNGQTNINVDNEFIVFGLENLKGETASLGIFLIMDYCLSKIKEDTTKPKALFVDEWWKIAQNPVGAQFTMEMAKLIRALGGALILATQQLSDVFALDGGKYGAAVIGNCPIKILMKMKETDALKVQELLLLTDFERDQLCRNERGHALLCYGDNKLNIEFIASETENRLINTDPKFLAKLAKEKEKKEKQMALQKKLESAPDYTDKLFNFNEYYDDEDIKIYSLTDYVNKYYTDIPEALDTGEYIKRYLK